MKLSIIIPVFNGERFIKRSYESILNQNLKSIKYELIYIDNNSTDNTFEILKSMQSIDSTIKIFHQSKQGEAYARNMGIEMAKGEYIYQLDIDDEVYPDALKRMITVLESYPNVEAVFGKMVKSSKPINETEKPVDETHEVILKEPPYWGLHWFSSLRNVVGPPAFLYRKHVFDKIGKYNVELKIGTDTALDIKLGMLSRVAFIDTYIYLYYRHHKSVMQIAKQNNSVIFQTWKRYTKEHLQFYFDNEVPFRFKKILFSQLFAMMGKLIFYTKGYSRRKLKLKELYSDIKPLKLPFYIRLYLITLVFLPQKPLLKFYVYYLSPWYIKRYGI